MLGDSNSKVNGSMTGQCCSRRRLSDLASLIARPLVYKSYAFWASFVDSETDAGVIHPQFKGSNCVETNSKMGVLSPNPVAQTVQIRI